MPGLVQETPFQTITVRGLHPTFGAEIQGADFNEMSDEQLNEVKAAIAKYGFVVFRDTKLTDDSHVAFSRRLGELDNIARYVTPGRKLRYTQLELFDASNLDGDGEIVPSDSPQAHYNKGNALFHVDSSFNPRRASFSLLRAVAIPPPGQGGATEFADARAAWDDLGEETRALLLNGGGGGGGLVGAHSISHSRKLGSPEFFRDLDPSSSSSSSSAAAAPPMARHRVAQVHEPSGRGVLYVGAHLHHIEGLDGGEGEGGGGGEDLVRRLNEHATRPRYVARVEWDGPGDLVVWDNRAVLHRATGGPFEYRHKRDMRRTTVHDDGAEAWGLNPVGAEMPGFDSTSRPGAKRVQVS